MPYAPVPVQAECAMATTKEELAAKETVARGSLTMRGDLSF